MCVGTQGSGAHEALAAAASFSHPLPSLCRLGPRRPAGSARRRWRPCLPHPRRTLWRCRAAQTPAAPCCRLPTSASPPPPSPARTAAHPAGGEHRTATGSGPSWRGRAVAAPTRAICHTNGIASPANDALNTHTHTHTHQPGAAPSSQWYTTQRAGAALGAARCMPRQPSGVVSFPELSPVQG